jgi:hypothetical protein
MCVIHSSIVLNVLLLDNFNKRKWRGEDILVGNLLYLYFPAMNISDNVLLVIIKKYRNEQLVQEKINSNK